MAKIFFVIFLLNISLSLHELTPDKDNSILLQENEIICKRGTNTYKINNYQNKNYFLLILDYYISDYALYEGDNKIEKETYSSNDYFFRINGNNILYLVVNPYIDYCISFRFVDSNSITLKENEEFLHPIVDYYTRITTKINNVKNKHLIFYVKDIYSYSYYIYVNSKSYHKYSSGEVLSIIPEEDELTIEIEIVGSRVVAALKYISLPYTNITSDIFKCMNETEFYAQTYFINPNKTKDYIFISYNDNSFEYYKDDKTQYSLNEFNTKSNDNLLLLQNDTGCFQVLYLDNRWIEIEEGKSYNILNSESYSFLYHNSNGDLDSFILLIYSTENNFLNKLKVENKIQNLQIEKENDLYVYKINVSLSWDSKYYISIYANFNLNSKDFINVEFKIKEDINEEEGLSSTTIGLIIMFSIIGGILLIGVVARIIEVLLKVRKENKEKERKRTKLLEEKKFRENARNIYQLIVKDYTLINKVCLICSNIDKSIIIDDDVNEIDVVEDINNGRFDNLHDYITPKSCCHLYHDKCCDNENWNKRKLKVNTTCHLCLNFMTLDNMKKFGCFFTEKAFIGSLDLHKDNNQIKRENIKNIEDIFYSKLDTSYKIDKTKRDKLFRLKKINAKFLKNNDILYQNYFKYYSMNYNSCDFDELEDNLDEEIKQEKRRRQRIYEQEREYEEQNRKTRLKICSGCYNTCLYCNGNIKNSFPNGYGNRGGLIFAHNKCINDKYSCCICHSKKGTEDCNNCCNYCQKKNPLRYCKCYYCKKHFD